VRHAGADDLEPLAPLLAQLRSLEGLTEKSPGTFYRRSKAFLHFHHDPSGLFADLRLDPQGDFERMRVSTKVEQARFLAAVRRATGG
jgi:hypothetical protein